MLQHAIGENADPFNIHRQLWSFTQDSSGRKSGRWQIKYMKWRTKQCHRLLRTAFTENRPQQSARQSDW